MDEKEGGDRNGVAGLRRDEVERDEEGVVVVLRDGGRVGKWKRGGGERSSGGRLGWNGEEGMVEMEDGV